MGLLSDAHKQLVDKNGGYVSMLNKGRQKRIIKDCIQRAHEHMDSYASLLTNIG